MHTVPRTGFAQLGYTDPLFHNPELSPMTASKAQRPKAFSLQHPNNPTTQ